MSKNLVKGNKDGSESSGPSLHSHRSCWMSRWSQPASKQGSLIAPHSKSFSKDESLNHMQKLSRTSCNISSDNPRSYAVVRNNTKPENVGLGIGSLTIRAQNVGKERSAFCFLGHSRNRESSWTRTPMDPSCSYAAKSPQIHMDQGSDECEEYSAILVHKRRDFSPFLSNDQFNEMQIDYQADAPSSCHGHEALEGLRFPVVRNMKICTGVGNSNGRPPLYSQTTTHHVLFTSRMRESTERRGVKLQPLWSSTDSEKDNFGDAETPRGERSFDLSAETHAMDTDSLSNKNGFSGIRFPSIAKSTATRGKTLVMASVDPREDKIRGKLQVKETPTNTNSMDGVEPSTSRTQSMETEHLLSCAEQPSDTKCFLAEPSDTKSMHIDESVSEEPSCKRMKLNSIEVGESSSHEKTHMFFNMLTKQSTGSLKTLLPSVDEKHASKEKSIQTQNVGPMMNADSSSTSTKNPIFQSSWIQRWCQDRSMSPDGDPSKSDPSKSVVICEPTSSKLPLDEIEKKKFPSIAAIALMGKSLDGLHACKFTKRGPLVFWNTENY